MKPLEPDWATHKVEWGGMVCFCNEERYDGYGRNGGRMWSGHWSHPGHKEEWLECRRSQSNVTVTSLILIQENE